MGRAFLSEYLSSGFEDFVEGSSSSCEFLAEDFTLSVSVLTVVKRLGYEDLAEELMPLVKSLVGEIVVRLSTGRYIEGLAHELGLHARRLWESDYSDAELADVIRSALELRERLESGEVDEDAVREVLDRFLKIVRVDVSRTKVIKGVVENPEPALALQLMATALAVCVGGLGGSQRN
ncbi:MAG: hypothetical protein QW116_00545 [Zestosphaera sp.]